MNQPKNKSDVRAEQESNKQTRVSNETPSPLTKRSRRWPWFLLLAIAFALGFGGGFSRDAWLPYLMTSFSKSARHDASVPGAGHDEAHAEDTHGEDDHTKDVHGEDAHAGHNPLTSLELSETGRKNVGLSLLKIELRDFERTVNIPAMIVERPGRTRLKVSAPMTGVISRVYPIAGEAVKPGQPLFDLRLTHEDLVQKQSQFLQTIEQLDVIKREVARLDKVTSSGAIAGKQLLERQYEQQQTEAQLHAEKQALVLHGLTKEQVESIVLNRELLQNVTVVAPRSTDCEACGRHDEYLQVAQLSVSPGEQVTAGMMLCTLNDHCELYIEGRAFEEDAGALNRAADSKASITAVVEENGNRMQTVSNLKILYVQNEVEVASRVLRFYVKLANQLVRNEDTTDGHRFITWRFKPGQRVQLVVPVEKWEDRIVLPVDAVINDGADWFVFQQFGDHFDRQAVHVEYRNQWWTVIENDGTLHPGDVVAASGAYQMHLAVKNKTGGGVDPHAGHNH